VPLAAAAAGGGGGGGDVGALASPMRGTAATHGRNRAAKIIYFILYETVTGWFIEAFELYESQPPAKKT
jgi:hypothetical protein